MKLTKEKLQAFEFAVRNYYFYQAYIDELPIMGSVGELDESDNSAYLWTHRKFDMGFNGKQIVDVNMTSEKKVKLELGAIINFTYEVNWKPSPVQFADRFDKYLDPNFFQHRIHWFSIFNSFMMVIFLVGLVTMILMRTLRKDYARYNRDEEMDDMDRDLGDEYGWKQVHGDVFRPPAYPMAFSILIGTGWHIGIVTFLVICFQIMGDLYTSRGIVVHYILSRKLYAAISKLFFSGSMLSTSIFAYAATAPVNGYFGGSLYAQTGGKRWIKQMFLSAFAFPTMVCGTAFFINFISIYYHASRAIQFTTMVALVQRIYNYRVSIVFYFSFFIACHRQHLSVHHTPADAGGHSAGPQRQRRCEQSLPCECRPAANSGEEVVHGAAGHCPPRWHPSLWQHIHRDVLYLHLLLGLQNLLRLRLHDAGFPHSHGGDQLRDNCLHLLSTQRRGLPMVRTGFCV